jgi:hypothetical protein
MPDARGPRRPFRIQQHANILLILSIHVPSSEKDACRSSAHDCMVIQGGRSFYRNIDTQDVQDTATGLFIKSGLGSLIDRESTPMDANRFVLLEWLCREVLCGFVFRGFEFHRLASCHWFLPPFLSLFFPSALASAPRPALGSLLQKCYTSVGCKTYALQRS